MNEQSFSPYGRTVLVSGANRGIGRAIAMELHGLGYQLSLGARDLDSLDPLIVDLGPERVMVHRYEATQADSCRDWVAATKTRFGHCDAVVNNAGTLDIAPFEDDDESGLDLMWEVNVKGPLRLLRAAWPDLKRCGSGRVVNLVSLSGKRVKSARVGAYSVTKYAALALTHWVRQEGWDHGIRATALCPGFVATDMSAQLTDFPPANMIQPETIATLVATVLGLPNNAAVAELPVSCVLEASY